MLPILLPVLAHGFQVSSQGPAPLIPSTSYVVLASEVDPGLRSGLPVLVQATVSEYGQEGIVAWEPGGIPTELQAWEGRSVVLQAEGLACETQVIDLKIIRRMSWMNGFSNLEACTSATPECREAIRAAVIEESSELLLVGEVSTTCGITQTAMAGTVQPLSWATDHSSVTSVQRGIAMEQLARLPAYQSLATEAGELPYGPLFEEDAVVRVFSGERTLVSVTGAPSYCGEYAGELWAVWEVLPSGVWKPLFVQSKAFFPDVVVQEQGELTWYSWDGKATSAGQSTWAAPWKGCAC